MHNLVDQLTATDKPVWIKIPRLRGEMEEAKHIANIALNFAPTPNLEFNISNLGQITKEELEHVPQNPRFWTKCVKTVCKLAEMTN